MADVISTTFLPPFFSSNVQISHLGSLKLGDYVQSVIDHDSITEKINKINLCQ